MALSNSLERLCEQVQYGTSARFNCPKCMGVNSLSITKAGLKVIYHCFKARCELNTGGSRFIKLSHEELASTVSHLNASRNQLEGPTELKLPFRPPTYWVYGIASKKCFQTLLNGNALEAYEKGLYRTAYDPKQDRLIFLVRDREGRTIGGIGKSLSGQKPKVYNYPDSANIPFKVGTGKTAVLVEDCLSACSIGRLEEYIGIALLGTEIKKEYLYNILLEYKDIVIALDKDALHKSIKLRKIIQEFKDKVVIWALDKDLKELDKASLIDFIINKANKLILN